MTTVDICRPFRETCEKLLEKCYLLFPCLSDPGMRSTLCLKVALLLLHVIVVGALFLFDGHLIQKTRKEPWYTVGYLLLFVATLVQYFFTAGSSPGYVLDAMRAGNERNTTVITSSKISKQSASRKSGNLISSTDCELGRNTARVNSMTWMKLVMDLYPPGSSSRNWTCNYCSIVLPPRAKHCHDCDKCVLQFDHHCVWLGTCIGQGNHCRFWWYIFEETLLCIWTAILYITYLSMNNEPWWKEGIAILLLAILSFCLLFLLLLLIFHSYLILTNQTTYELVRRRRILYLREIPERVHPFSKGICGNLYTFCCSRENKYTMEPVPTREELEAKARPYTFVDVICCRCC